MASVERRVSALEQYVNELVAERMKLEVEAMLDLLEKHLSREEYVKVARIIVDEGADDDA